MSTATHAIQAFLLFVAMGFALFFIYFAAGVKPEKGYKPDIPDGALESVATLLVATELVASIAAVLFAFNLPETSTLNLIDAGHADMTSYWVVALLTIALTPVLMPPIYWGAYWVLAGTCWLLRTPYAAFTRFVEWWGGVIFKNKD